MKRFIVLFVALVVFLVSIQLVRNNPQSELLSSAYVQKIMASDGKMDPTATKGVWFDKDVSVPVAQLAEVFKFNTQNVLAANTSDKWIEVDLTHQRMYAHEGDRIVYDFAISSGLPWMPTVTGTYYIWAKVRSQRMTGGSIAAGTYYDLPNVPFVEYFYKGYSLHGTYWHHDFGFPRSHGCVNLSIPDAEKLYYWTNPILSSNQYSDYNIPQADSTRVVVYGTTPTKLN